MRMDVLPVVGCGVKIWEIVTVVRFVSKSLRYGTVVLKDFASGD